MTEQQRLELIREMTGCTEVYAVPGFQGYFVTRYGEIYSFRRSGVIKPSDTPRKMNPTRMMGNTFVALSRNGVIFRRTVAFILEHARHGIDPSVNKLEEIQRLTRELADTQAQLDAVLNRRANAS